VLGYVGFATAVQTQDVHLLNQLETEVVEEAKEEEHDENNTNNLDFMDDFPNFYSMAAEMLDQLNETIPEVRRRHFATAVAGAAHKEQLCAGVGRFVCGWKPEWHSEALLCNVS
jgi:hypothetical protein